MNKKSIYLIIGILVIIILGFLFFSGNSSGVTGEVILDNPDLIGDPDKVTIYFFWGDGCPHCSTQKPYLEEWAEEYGDNIEIKRFETWKNPENIPLFQEVASAYGIQARGVPTTFIGEKHWVGFSSSMAPEMKGYIEYCIENTCETPIIN
ncbi:MAG: thioredoxin family protein [Candidatus Pacearchaeota archaeon]